MKVNILSKISIIIVLIAHLLFSSANVNAYTLAEQLVELSEFELAQEPDELLNNEDDNIKNIFSKQKTLRIKVTELRDNSGLVYLGGVVSKADLAPYLKELEIILGNNFEQYRRHQSQRDHGLFHLTLINPNEYQFIDKSKVTIGQQYTVTLLGLGKVANTDKESYFVVAQSSDAQFFRQQQILPFKDLHVTLGFSPQDIYGVSKGKSTLLKNNSL